MMTTVRQLIAELSNLQQDAQIFIAVPTRDHWETVNRTHIDSQILTDQQGLYVEPRVTSYALQFGQVDGKYNSQNFYDGLLWLDVEEPTADDDEVSKWDEESVLAYLREDEDNVLWANNSETGDLLRGMAARNLVVIGKNNRVTLPTFTRPDSGDGLTYTRV